MVRERWKDEENRFHERFRRVVLPF
jgi:hypothetical protein